MLSRRQWALLGALALLALAVLGLYDPAVPGRYPPCPFRWLTGLDCPGCGSLRATHALLRLHPVRAFNLNPLYVLALPFMLAWIARAAWRDLVEPGLRPWTMPGWFGWFVLAAVVAFWMARNLPWAPFAWMRA